MNDDLNKSIEEMYKEISIYSGTPQTQMKGVVMHITVSSPDGKNDSVTYNTRIYEGLPNFNYLPRGREIFHRLIIKAA